MKAIISAAVGAAGMYLFDPQLGRTRRAKLAQKMGAANRRMARNAEQKAEYARGQAEGLRHLGSSDSPPENDPALVAKIESEVLTRWNYPKGDINVNAINGIVELRGICESPDQIDELEQEVRKISGVVDVRNYLHLPNTPAPNKADALDTR